MARLKRRGWLILSALVVGLVLALAAEFVLCRMRAANMAEHAPEELRSVWSSEGRSSAELARALHACDRYRVFDYLQRFLRKGMDYTEVIETLGPPDDLWPTERLREAHRDSITAAGACIRYKTGRCRPGTTLVSFEVTEICFHQDRTLAFWSGQGLADQDPMAGYDDTRSTRKLWPD